MLKNGLCKISGIGYLFFITLCENSKKLGVKYGAIVKLLQIKDNLILLI